MLTKYINRAHIRIYCSVMFFSSILLHNNRFLLTKALIKYQYLMASVADTLYESQRSVLSTGCRRNWDRWRGHADQSLSPMGQTLLLMRVDIRWVSVVIQKFFSYMLSTFISIFVFIFETFSALFCNMI